MTASEISGAIDWLWDMIQRGLFLLFAAFAILLFTSIIYGRNARDCEKDKDSKPSKNRSRR